jgi:pimeloyl-ACP methyl ester carboxylesterase
MLRRNGPSLVSILCSLAAAALLAVAPVASHAWQPAKKKEKEFPEPDHDVKIEVKFAGAKLVMMCTYYPSELGKEAVPVLLLHGYEGNRADYAYLATYLQHQGHAVIVPDLRAHGDSTEMLLANGKRVELQPKKMTKADFNLLVRDLEAVKSYILQKNNAEELNMERLVVVGADMSTVTAMNFAMRDWDAQELLSYKNAKDVKALVLLSPDQGYRGSDMRVALKHPVVGHQLSVMIAVGKKESSALSEAKSVLNQLERQHGEATAEKRPEEKEVVFYAADTNLQGTKLVARNLDVVPIIAKFIEFRVMAFAEDFEWTARIKP